MALKIEDYALLGDTQSAALVGRDGSIDWLCLPRFDSDACFAALLGDERHGRWLIAPEGGGLSTRRRYRPDTLVLETTFVRPEGEVRVVDSMPIRQDNPDVVRIVEGVRGDVPMTMTLSGRFGYGAYTPWIRRWDGAHTLIAGPDALSLRTDVPVQKEGANLKASFRVSAGQRAAFLLTWHPSHLSPPDAIDPCRALEESEAWWRDWTSRCTYQGEYRDQVVRSLITLKALTYRPTGGIVAAVTTSLPERIGGSRNWDYRYCWLRDATFTLLALIHAGYKEEAEAFKHFLRRAVAGDPSELQIMYGLSGERRLSEFEASWLPGYEGSRPVRLGNAAALQLQLDVYGEVIDSAFQARRRNPRREQPFWELERSILDFLENAWKQPDNGIWEMRGGRRHFTYSKVMAWAAMDRAIATVERFGAEGPVERWRRTRAEIHEEVLRRGFDSQRGSFVQAYGSKDLDASLLLIPLVGFLPPADPRVEGTVEAIRRELCQDGFVMRYSTDHVDDGVHGSEGAFLACSFWLADDLYLMGRAEEAQTLFRRLLGVANDVGLLSEEYDVSAKRLVGNFPQAFSHVSLVNTAANLSKGRGPADDRPNAGAITSSG